MSHIEQEPVSASGADDLDCNSLGVGSLSISAVEADEDAYDPKPSAAGNIIKPFLARNCPEFVELSEVRERVRNVLFLLSEPPSFVPTYFPVPSLQA